MTNRQELINDKELYELYERFISSSYPAFLNKLGLDRVATQAEGATITDSKGKNYIDCVGGYGLFNVGQHAERDALRMRIQIALTRNFYVNFEAISTQPIYWHCITDTLKTALYPSRTPLSYMYKYQRSYC